MAKKTPSEKSLIEEINENLIILNTDYDREEDELGKITAYKSVVCPFNKNNPACIGCIQSLERLEYCVDEYRENIVNRPALLWTPEFVAIEERDVTVSNPMQRLQCDTCYFADNCPQYKVRSSCTIQWGGDLHTLEPKDQISVLIKLQESRINIARTAELMDGGMPDQTLSNEMDRLTDLINMKANIGAERFSMTVQASGGNSSNTGGGILAKLFAPKQEQLPQSQHDTIPTKNIQEAEVIEEVKRVKNKPKKSEL